MTVKKKMKPAATAAKSAPKTKKADAASKKACGSKQSSWPENRKISGEIDGWRLRRSARRSEEGSRKS